MKLLIKILCMGTLLSSTLWAGSANQTPLFGKVINISKSDTLNVRSQPYYKAEKVGEIPFDAYIGIEKCKIVKKSTWCRVYPLIQNWYDQFWEEKNIGWVNARYLKFNNRGYVIIKGKKNCAYALNCYRGKCEVVDNFGKENVIYHKKTGFKTKWIAREYLKGESNFGATPDNIDGYCNNGIYIEECFKIKNKNH